MLDEQVRKGAASASQPAAEAGNGHFNTYSGQSRQNGRSYSNGSGQGRSNDRSNRSGGGGRTLTQAQGRAITNMARKLNVDAGQWAYDQFGCAVGQLTVKQASEAINRLKEQIDHEGVSR